MEVIEKKILRVSEKPVFCFRFEDE